MSNITVNSKEEALCQLFLHCCFKDGEFKTQELDYVSHLFVELDLHTALNFKNQVLTYKNNKPAMVDEAAYLSSLLKHINPVHDYALYSYCAEILLCDASLDLTEEKLLENLAELLEITSEKQDLIKALTAQRKAVEMQKIF